MCARTNSARYVSSNYSTDSRGLQTTGGAWNGREDTKDKQAIDFPELTQHALARLFTDRRINQSPHDAFIEIYQSPSLYLASPDRPEKLAVKSG